MYKYKLIISYDGTDYYGWQSQKKLPSVCATLQKIFYTIFNQSIIVKGISRTDAGVHALGQVASFVCPLNIDPNKMLFAWNNKLPSSIVIRSIEKIDPSISLFDEIDYKVYQYHFFLERPLPFIARYGWYYYYRVDLDKLHECLKVFIGTHDFSSFRSSEDPRENTVRTIHDISLEYLKRYKVYRITVVGTSFLRHMIRRLVGACIEVASRDHMPVRTLVKALEAKDPHQQLPNAPSHGLLLRKIIYKNEES